MSVIMSLDGMVKHRSLNLRDILSHARHYAVVGVKVRDTDGRLAELNAEAARTGLPANRRYEYLVQFRNGDVGRAFFADWRVAADFTAARRSWRHHLSLSGKIEPLQVESDVPGFLNRYQMLTAPKMPRSAVGRLPVRDDVETVTLHRNPTPSEVRFGHGAIHYADFTVEEACWPGSRILKRWIKSPHDGLRYYR